MKILERLRSRFAALAHDLLMIPAAWFGAYWVRFNLEPVPFEFFRFAVEILPLVVLIQGTLFWHFGLYRGIWRFASMPDLIRITKSVAFGAGAVAIGIFLLTRMEGIPRSVLPIYSLLLLALVGGPRFIYRWFKDHKLYKKECKKALIVGAGKAGEMLVRDLLRDPHPEYEPAGFVDDNSKKRGQEIHGIRVLGASDDIQELAAGVDVILIALPSATSKEMRRIVELCEQTRVPFRTLPRLGDFVSGYATVQALRKVNIDDLLGREAVTLEKEILSRSSRGKVILVTGGGGSIGSELCRQIARLGPAQLVVLDHSEFNLYSIDMELRTSFPAVRAMPVLGDVGDDVLMDTLLGQYQPDVIFHAAAYKHVPMLENQIRPAVINNVLGTRKLAKLACKHNCKSFILISSDKAVKPGNVMGATKHVAEIYCQGMNAKFSTHFVTVRFGNVLGSAGSVIPLFQKQIAEGGPVTVTDLDVTRYFMTIPEAAQLILQASSVGKGGEIFVLNMGEPINISYLAQQLILLSGKRPGEDIKIVYTGLRPGEKPFEELFHDMEELIETPHPKTLLARSRKVDLAALERRLDALAEAAGTNDEGEMKRLLSELIQMSDKDNIRTKPHMELVAQRKSE